MGIWPCAAKTGRTIFGSAPVWPDRREGCPAGGSTYTVEFRVLFRKMSGRGIGREPPFLQWPSQKDGCRRQKRILEYTPHFPDSAGVLRGTIDLLCGFSFRSVG